MDCDLTCTGVGQSYICSDLQIDYRIPRASMGAAMRFHWTQPTVVYGVTLMGHTSTSDSLASTQTCVIQ